MAVKDAVSITYIDRDNEVDKVLEKKSPSGLGISNTVKKEPITPLRVRPKSPA
jgi:hypothetical protein